MIFIRVTYRVKPGERDAFIKALIAEEIPACTQKENGNLAYDFMLPIDNPDTVCLIEQWENQACLEEHTKQAKYRRLGELRAELGVEREMLTVYDVQSCST